MARVLDGSTNWLSAADDPALDLTGEFALFIRLNTASIAANAEIFTKWDFTSGNQRSYRFFSLGTSGLLKIAASSNGSTPTFTGTATDNALSTGVAYALICKYNDVDTFSFFVNGNAVAVTQAGIFGSVFNSTAETVIGANDGGTASKLNANYVADAAIYKGPGVDALVTAQIAQIFADGCPAGECLSQQTVAWWPMIRGATNVDWSGNGNNLTDNGTVVTIDHPPIKPYNFRRSIMPENTIDQSFPIYPALHPEPIEVEAY